MSAEAEATLSMFERFAKSVLSLAAAGGMPDTFWHTDSRVTMARTVLGWSVEYARDWAFDNMRYHATPTNV